MTYLVLVLVLLAGFMIGWLFRQAQVSDDLERLHRLTDRDERGRFVRREP